MKPSLHSNPEPLEQRIAPATIVNPLSIGGTTQATFTDADGDVVTVRIAGSAGSVNFLDGGGNPVDDTDDIASAVITGASSNFTLTYSVDVGAGAGVVLMGDITSDKILRGIYSVPDSTGGSTFTLGSFKGVNFSADGGLVVDTIVGDAADVGLQLSGGLHKDAVITVRGDLDADIILGDGKDLIDGTLFVGGSGTAGSDLTINGTTGVNFSWVQRNQFQGAATFNGLFNGTINIDGNTNGVWTFNKDVAPVAVLHSDDFDNVIVNGHFSGLISTESSDVNMNVSGDLKSSARVQGSGGITLTVGGNVLPGASAVCDNGLTFTVGGNMSGTFVAGSSDLFGTVTGNVAAATLVSSSDASITVTGSVMKSTIEADNELFLDITGGVTDSDISSGHSDSLLTIDGSVKKSRFSGDTTGTIGSSITDTRFRASNFDDVSITVTGGLTRTIIETDNEIVVNATGTVANSRFISTTGGVSLTVGGNLLKTTAISSDDDISMNVTGNVLGGSFLTDDSQQTWTIGGNFQGLFMTGSGDLTMSVGGSVLKGSQFLQGDNMLFSVGRDFDAIVIADDFELQVGGHVASGTRITVNEIRDQGDADTIGFSVGGDFGGVLNTGTFDPNSDGTAGQTHVLVAGNVTKTARFNIGDIAGTSADDTYSFGGAFLGRLAIGGDLDVDLDFAGAVARIIVGGAIQDTIAVTGKLTQLVAGGSLFTVTTPGTAGDFVDHLGVITGNVTATGGFVSVLPGV